MKLTIAITKGDEYFLGTIKEIPSVITQGVSVEETKENLLDALQLYLESMQSEPLANTVLEEDLKIA